MHCAQPRRSRFALAAALLGLTALAPASCGRTEDGSAQGGAKKPGAVVVYYSADDVYARPILEEFERRTGIDVRGVTDTEATKNTGLVQRLRAERTSPKADVFWSGEVFLTIQLAKEGLLAPHASATASERPEALRGADGLWHGFAQRARVLVVNTDRVPEAEAPTNLVELMDPRWRGRVAMARPQFGTTRGHMGALVAMWGEANTRQWLATMKNNGLRLYDGNSAVVTAVALGEADIGLTDTDDVHAGLRNGWPVALVHVRHDLPNGASFGPLVIPNSVALVRGGPNPEAGAKLVDYLLGPDAERALAASDSRNAPVNASVAAEFPDLALPEPARVHLEDVAASVDAAMRLTRETLGE